MIAWYNRVPRYPVTQPHPNVWCIYIYSCTIRTHTTNIIIVCKVTAMYVEKRSSSLLYCVVSKDWAVHVDRHNGIICDAFADVLVYSSLSFVGRENSVIIQFFVFVCLFLSFKTSKTKVPKKNFHDWRKFSLTKCKTFE